MFGVCNVNFCKALSIGECRNCNDVPFCGDHADHFKFHFRRCQYVDCRNKIGVDAASCLAENEFRSKISPCNSLKCFKNNFMFCSVHSEHGKHRQVNIPNIGYIFDGMESVCNGQRNFQCTINSGNYGVSSVKLDSYFVKSVPLVPVVSSSVLTLTAPKRRYHGDIRSCSVNKHKDSKKLRVSNKSISAMDTVDESVSRFEHVCSHCNKKILSSHMLKKDALVNHWRRFCVLSGKVGGDEVLEIEKDLTICNFASNQLPVDDYRTSFSLKGNRMQVLLPSEVSRQFYFLFFNLI